MRFVAAILVAAMSLSLAGPAFARKSTASQREYQRGYKDCLAGKWDENQHGASYKQGCRAAEDKRGAAAGGAAGTQDGGAPAAPSSRMPSKNEQACLQKVSQVTKNGDVVLLSSETSEANDSVIVGVGSSRAKWRCLVKRGIVSDVTSLTNEGNL